MRGTKRILSAALLVILVLMLSVSALAANDPYTYTVRIYPGNYGTASSGDYLEMTGIAPGTSVTIEYTDSTISLNGGTITLSDAKYFIKGVRESGTDKPLEQMSFTLDGKMQKDWDLVVAYGMRGTAVEYTINYVVSGTGEV
ncbi:MAG: hypothetical protein IJ052_03960, partial [Oscillospiraceae bacterium]|nr:hypothetical protein [Oscillospiraceae bacterium]